MLTSNATEVVGQLTSVADRIEDPRAALERARALLARQEAEVFSTQGRAIGESWPAAVEDEGHQLLVRTGALLASVTAIGAGEIDGPILRFGTDVPYAMYLQAGTSRMAARPFLGLNPELGRILADLISQAATLHGE
jgi:phage gpG-like protein